MKFRNIAVAAAFTCAAAPAALAAPTYGNIAAPGVYFGDGNPNGNWNIDTANNIEVALRAKNRSNAASPVLIDGADGVYYVQPGFCAAVNCGGSGNRAFWNYEFSINVRADGTGTGKVNDFFIQLEVDTNPSMATSFVLLNVLSNWTDNEYWDGTDERKGLADATQNEYGVQQSANPAFANSGFGFVPGAGLYDLRLSVFTAPGGQLLASTDVQISVIPEPGSLALTGLALFGLAAARRRKAA